MASDEPMPQAAATVDPPATNKRGRDDNASEGSGFRDGDGSGRDAIMASMHWACMYCRNAFTGSHNWHSWVTEKGHKRFCCQPCWDHWLQTGYAKPAPPPLFPMNM